MNYYGLLIYVNLTCRFNHQKQKNHERIQRYLRQFQVWLVPTSHKPVQIVLSWSKVTNYGFFPIMDCQSTMGHLGDRKSTWRTLCPTLYIHASRIFCDVILFISKSSKKKFQHFKNFINFTFPLLEALEDKKSKILFSSKVDSKIIVRNGILILNQDLKSFSIENCRFRLFFFRLSSAELNFCSKILIFSNKHTVKTSEIGQKCQILIWSL